MRWYDPRGIIVVLLGIGFAPALVEKAHPAVGRVGFSQPAFGNASRCLSASCFMAFRNGARYL